MRFAHVKVFSRPPLLPRQPSDTDGTRLGFLYRLVLFPGFPSLAFFVHARGEPGSEAIYFPKSCKGDLVVPFGASSRAVPLLNSPPDARKLSDSYIKHNFVLFALPLFSWL